MEIKNSASLEEALYDEDDENPVLISGVETSYPKTESPLTQILDEIFNGAVDIDNKSAKRESKKHVGFRPTYKNRINR